MVPNLSKPSLKLIISLLNWPFKCPKRKGIGSQPFFRSELAVSFKELDSIFVHSTRWGILPSCDPHRNRRNQTGKNGVV